MMMHTVNFFSEETNKERIIKNGGVRPRSDVLTEMNERED